MPHIISSQPLRKHKTMSIRVLPPKKPLSHGCSAGNTFCNYADSPPMSGDIELTHLKDDSFKAALEELMNIDHVKDP